MFSCAFLCLFAAKKNRWTILLREIESLSPDELQATLAQELKNE